MGTSQRKGNEVLCWGALSNINSLERKGGTIEDEQK